MAFLLQNLLNIIGLVFANGLEFLAICDVKVWAHIIGAISQLDLEVLVSKYLLLIAEDGIRELGVKRRNRLETRARRRHKANVERFVGILVPYSVV